MWSGGWLSLVVRVLTGERDVVWQVAVFGSDYGFEVSREEAIEGMGYVAAILDGECDVPSSLAVV
jgi:hypothetical protein